MRRLDAGRGRHSRPLRTYGKPPPSDGSPERTAVKKRKATSTIHQISIDTDQDVLLPAMVQTQEQLPTSNLPGRPRKKDSILDYFKVRSPKSDTSATCKASSDSGLPSSTPPSSPPTHDVPRRKRRRLATRPLSPVRGPELQGHDMSGPASSEVEPPPTLARTLQDASSDVLNRREAGSDAASSTTMKRRKTKPTVQTTLSLSVTEEQFVECKDCEMLYNPFYEQDVKLHARRHTAMLRKKRRVDSQD